MNPQQEKQLLSNAMSVLGKRRWAGKTKAERIAHMKMMSKKAHKVLSRKKLAVDNFKNKGDKTP